jgi:hypothetical protein
MTWPYAWIISSASLLRLAMATNGRPEWFGTAFDPVAKSTHCLRERKHALESIVQLAAWRTSGLTAGLGGDPRAREGDAGLVLANESGQAIRHTPIRICVARAWNVTTPRDVQES